MTFRTAPVYKEAVRPSNVFFYKERDTMNKLSDSLCAASFQLSHPLPLRYALNYDYVPRREASFLIYICRLMLSAYLQCPAPGLLRIFEASAFLTMKAFMYLRRGITHSMISCPGTGRRRYSGL